MGDFIRLCNHCNNVTPHQLIVDGGLEKGDNNERFTYFFFKCSTCGDYSLLGGNNSKFPDKKASEFPILFPTSNILDFSVPEDIRRVYSEAVQIKYKSPNAFAGQIRRAIEYLCKDKKASGKNLVNQLEALAEKGIIPNTLSEMTTIIRLLGNLGVHADEDEVTSSDTKDIDDFFRFILEYVYVAPAKLKQVRLNLEIRQIKSEYGRLYDEINQILFNEDPYPWLEDDHYGPPIYGYDKETVSIIKKLEETSTKAELVDYVIQELDFRIINKYHEDDFIKPIWDLWNKYKK